MKPTARKVAVTAHIVVSVGWLGAVAGFLALAIAGLVSDDIQLVRASYLAAHLTTSFVIVPLAFSTLATGVVVSVGSNWGIVRHYWVIAKLSITVASTALLLVHSRPIAQLAEAARSSEDLIGEAFRQRAQLVGDAGAALVALLVCTVLSVFKPWGMTRYAVRKGTALRPLPARVEPEPRRGVATPRWVYVAGIHAAAFFIAFLVFHVAARGGLHH